MGMGRQTEQISGFILPLLLKDAQTVDLQMRLVSENLLTKITRNNTLRFMGSFLNCGTAMKTGRSRQASNLLKACSAITRLGPIACWHFDF